MRIEQLPREVLDETITKAVKLDSTLQETAGTEHTDAEHALVNFKKFIPYTVTMLPGNVDAGKIPPKVRFVKALANIVIPSTTWTKKLFVDCVKATYRLQLPMGVDEFTTSTASLNDCTKHEAETEHTRATHGGRKLMPDKVTVLIGYADAGLTGTAEITGSGTTCK
jgi:hypothetical protein